MAHGPFWSAAEIAEARRMKAAGMSTPQIALILGRNRASVWQHLRHIHTRERIKPLPGLWAGRCPAFRPRYPQDEKHAD